MSFIGEAIATAAIDVLFMKLTSTKLLQFARRENIHADLNKWENKLLKIKAVLNDAAEKQLESQLVRYWLTDLKNLAYDVEDILDEFATEALKRELLDQSQASTSKVRKLVPSCFTALSPQSIKFNFKMASQIKKITDRLEEIVKQKNSLELKEIPGEKSSKVKYQSSHESTSLLDLYICGRENDKKAILDMLFKDEGTSTSVGVPVISILGMGGLGKTTLAQLVYNDKEVDTYFNFKAWASISEDFDIARVTKIVLQSIASGTGDGNNLNQLQVQLQEKLAGKKFLIVLDDVWHEINYEVWTKFCLPFQVCSFGSKIIITTRKERVASMANDGSIYRLEQLSNDNCLSILAYHALRRTDFNEHRDLKKIGEKIVDRCKGLPLAAKSLGGHLHLEFRNKDWEKLLDSRIWNLSEEESGILPALRVSYNYLSPPLQRCFAYCSIFPKGYEFEKKEIILLWMAEGFLQMDRNEKQAKAEAEAEAEDIGDEFFENLYSISFFQRSSSNFSRFVMHDLIHDLSQWAAEDFCLKVENVSEDEKKLKISKNLHHLSFVNVESITECITKWEASDEVIKSIRTFLPLYQFQRPCDFLNLLPRLRRLRVLSLSGYDIEDLPNTVSDLKHLRYLDLSNTAIKKLPDSINTLYNLEILKLEGCYDLENLYSDMGNLINLRHLYISKASSMERMPSGIGRLIHLRTLPFYLVGKDVGFGLKELKKLTHLQDEFGISGLENVNDIGDAKEADIIGKEKLRELELEWTSSCSDSRDIGIETQVLDMLQPYNKLEKLTIRSYGGTKFPSWLAHTSLSKLVHLTFINCKNCTSLPPIGQLPSLKYLYIIGLAGIKSISPEFYGNGCSTPFEFLEVLHIDDMQEWEDWNHLGFGKDNVGFPGLRELSIEGCPKLSGNLPEHLPLLESLSISSCEQLRMSILLLDCMIPDLTSLTVGGVNICKTFFEWGLHRLTSLKDLRISGGCPDMISIPMLPASLTALRIYDFWDLERLSPDFQDLSSLKELCLIRCPNLKFFPEKGLPSSLQHLMIDECPLLKQSCERYKGQYWPMIDLVPVVIIDGQPKWAFDFVVCTFVALITTMVTLA